MWQVEKPALGSPWDSPPSHNSSCVPAPLCRRFSPFETQREVLWIKWPDGTEVWGCCLDLTFCLGWMSVWGECKAKVIPSKAPNATDAHLSSSRSALYRQKHKSILSVLREISTFSQASSLLESSHQKHGGHADLKIHGLWKRVE